MDKEQILYVIRDLERMAKRAEDHLTFWSKPRVSMFPPNLEWINDLHIFIRECRRFRWLLIKYEGG